MTKLNCTLCKTDISIVPGSTKFYCPNCGKVTIVRCGKCRLISAKYTCPECKFIGP